MRPDQVVEQNGLWYHVNQSSNRRGHWKQWKLKTETEKTETEKLKLVKTSY